MADLITNLSDSIATAVFLCAEIKKTRHIGKSHTQLDLLEASLAAGPSALNLDSSPPLNEAVSKGLEDYISQMGEINGRLDHIAHPNRHKHGHHHHQKRSLLFPDWDPVRHEHKEMEDPHFGELRAGWETVRDGVEKLLDSKGDVVEKVTEELAVKLEVKEEVKVENEKATTVEEKKDEVKVEVRAETKADEKKEEKAEKKEEVVKVEKKEVAEVKVEEVEQAEV